MPRARLPLLACLAGLLLAAPAAVAADCPGADVQLTAANAPELRAAVLCLTNAERAAAGLAPFASEGNLEAAGQRYAERMVAERFFDHVGPDGSTLATRLAAYDGWRALGENLAWGEGELGTPRSTVAAWMGSPGHRVNLLSPDYLDVGIGIAPGTPGGSSRPSATYAVEYGVRYVSEELSGYEPAAPARVVRVAAKRRAAKPVPRRCARGTVARSSRSRGKRVVRCVRAARRT